MSVRPWEIWANRRATWARYRLLRAVHLKLCFPSVVLTGLYSLRLPKNGFFCKIGMLYRKLFNCFFGLPSTFFFNGFINQVILEEALKYSARPMINGFVDNFDSFMKPYDSLNARLFPFLLKSTILNSACERLEQEP